MDNLFTMDVTVGPKVSLAWRFYCSIIVNYDVAFWHLYQQDSPASNQGTTFSQQDSSGSDQDATLSQQEVPPTRREVVVTEQDVLQITSGQRRERRNISEVGLELVRQQELVTCCLFLQTVRNLVNRSRTAARNIFDLLNRRLKSSEKKHQISVPS